MTDSNTWQPDESEANSRWRRVLPQPKVRQFRWRHLIVGSVALAIGLTMLGLAIRQARQDQRIVQELNQFGPSCSYSNGWTFFDSATHRVVVLRFEFGDKLSDDDLVNLEGLTHLRSLDLAGSQVTDAGLVHLQAMTDLHHLDLDNTRITDAGVEHLRMLKQLESLSVKNTPISEGGVKTLETALPSCTVFHDVPFLPGIGRITD